MAWQRQKKENDDPWALVEQKLPPTERQRKENLRMIITIVATLLILGIGITLRYTVFAKRFLPAPMPTPEPIIISTPGPDSQARITETNP